MRPGRTGFSPAKPRFRPYGLPAMVVLLADTGQGLRRFYFSVWRWFCWTVVLGAVLPVGLLYLYLSLHNSHPAPMSSIAGHGELFIIAAVLLLGELRVLRLRTTGGGEGLFVVCLIVAILGLVAWGGILGASKPADDVDFSVTAGIIYLVMTVVLGAVAEGVGQ